MIIAFTGHRPDKLGSYSFPNPVSRRVCQEIREKLDWIRPSRAITGMAQGVDQWAAQICLTMEIPYVAAIPFVGQEMMWPEDAQKRWRYLLGRAAQVEVISEGSYTAKKMDLRNRWMVDHADLVLAVWDGTA